MAHETYRGFKGTGGNSVNCASQCITSSYLLPHASYFTDPDIPNSQMNLPMK